MNETLKTNDEQASLWNGVSGRAWIEAREFLDAMFQPFEDLLVEFAVARSGKRVLDVGCGTGRTTLALTRALGAASRCIGIDISEPMIAVARARAEQERTPATFIHGDAQVHDFDAASFDAIVSRFGVMFFEDSVRAFTNLHRSAQNGARLLAIAWRDVAENPFMTTAERAAAPLLANLPMRKPDASGQFAFADFSRVHRILVESGWTEIEINPIDVVCSFPEQALVPYLTRLGPLARVVDQLDESQRDQVVKTVRAAFEPYVHGAEVRFVTACWAIGATAG